MGRLLIIDGSNYLFRGHFALPNLQSKSGQATGAIKGMIEILMADIRILKPQYVAIVFDKKGKTFRHDIYPEYKANRKAVDKKTKDLLERVYSQKPILRKILKSLGFVVVQKTGIEGDDVIGAIAQQNCINHDVFIGTNDKDMYQLVSPKIRIWTKERTFDGPQQCVAKFGVEASQMVEYLMMVGDTADNIPGVHKCGPKTAAKLLAEHETLKNILKVKPFTPALRTNFKAAVPFFKTSRKLFKIDVDCISVDASRLKRSSPDWDTFTEICKDHGLNALYRTVRSSF